MDRVSVFDHADLQVASYLGSFIELLSVLFKSNQFMDAQKVHDSKLVDVINLILSSFHSLSLQAH